MRNTAPCVAYAAHRIQAANPDARMVVAPSDHLILNTTQFEETIQIAFDQSEKGQLVTLGIKPTRPDTGYGYIQWADDAAAINDRVKRVKTFTEKPDLELAKDFLASGDFSWNSGIFIWKVGSIVAAFEQFLPDMNKAFTEGQSVYGTPQEQAFINGMYSACENISIDYGIMEKADNVYVIPSSFGWSDLGTWGSLIDHMKLDENQNAIVGDHVFMFDTNNCLIHLPKDKVVLLDGIQDTIVVESDGMLMILRKDKEQDLKKYLKQMQEKNPSLFL
jgi:mannose-1-phosphate guanylyltransferase